jgi:DNA-binding phage protein
MKKQTFTVRFSKPTRSHKGPSRSDQFTIELSKQDFSVAKKAVKLGKFPKLFKILNNYALQVGYSALSRQAGLDRSSLYDILFHQKVSPREKTLVNLLKVFGLTLSLEQIKKSK